MNLDITIKDVFETRNLLEQNADVYRVVSISSRDNKWGTPFKELKGAKEILYLKFDDVTETFLKRSTKPEQFTLATKEDCQKVLEFLEKGGKCLVHCAAGVSRSTAMTLGFLLTKSKNYQEAVDYLYKIRSCATPNTYVVKLMCEILERTNEYEEILDYIDVVRLGISKNK